MDIHVRILFDVECNMNRNKMIILGNKGKYCLPCYTL